MLLSNNNYENKYLIRARFGRVRNAPRDIIIIIKFFLQKTDINEIFLPFLFFKTHSNDNYQLEILLLLLHNLYLVNRL